MCEVLPSAQLFARTEMMNCDTSFYPRFLQGIFGCGETRSREYGLQRPMTDLSVRGAGRERSSPEVKAEGLARGQRASQTATKPQSKGPAGNQNYTVFTPFLHLLSGAKNMNPLISNHLQLLPRQPVQVPALEGRAPRAQCVQAPPGCPKLSRFFPDFSGCVHSTYDKIELAKQWQGRRNEAFQQHAPVERDYASACVSH